MKIVKVFAVFCFSLILISGLSGCGSSTDTATTTTAPATTTSTPATTTTTIAPGATIAISGSLVSSALPLSASIGTQDMRAQASAYAIANYNVVAVSKDSGQLYFASAETDATGSFTIPNLPAGESFYLEILNDSNQLVAPVAFGTAEGKPVMAVDPGASNLALGAINYSSTDKAAAPNTFPTSVLDLSTSVDPKAGDPLVPKSAGNLGKGSEAQMTSGTYDSSKVDGEGDGLPNMFDGDNNGDLIIDEFDGLATRETLTAATSKVGFSALWTNLKVPYGSTVANVVNTPTGYWVIASISPKAGYTIASATLEAGPSWVQNAKIHQSNVTDGGSTWQSVGYKLYSHPTDSTFQVILGGIEIEPAKVVKAGDTLTFWVTFSGGGYEKVAKMINFAIADIPKLKGYYFGHWSSTSDFTSQYLPDGMSNKMLTENPVSTSEFSLKWQKATDESGAYLEGATYAWEVGDGNYVTPQVTTEIGSAYVYGYANLSPYVLRSANEFGCAIGMVSTMGDNAVQNCTFAKTTTWGTTEIVNAP